MLSSTPLKSLLYLALFLVSTTTATTANNQARRIQSREPAACSNGRTANNPQCCIWYDVLDDLQDQFYEGGKCNEDAHDALRLTFHDAIAYSPSQGGGGADGSIIQFSDIELTYDANNGLDDVVEALRGVANRRGVSYGDIIQFAGVISVRNCPGGPVIPFFAGRPAPTAAAPDGLIPSAIDSVDKMLARMADAGFSPNELVDLLAAHSVGYQEHVDPTIPFTPFDSTPEIFDTQFFLETMLRGTTSPGDELWVGEELSPIPGEFRLTSDWALARDRRTSCYWQQLATEQQTMATNFAKAMAKLALVGQDASQLVDCSDVVPVPSKADIKAPTLPSGKTARDLELTCKNPPNGNACGKLPNGKGPKQIPPAFWGHHGGHGKKKYSYGGSQGGSYPQGTGSWIKGVWSWGKRHSGSKWWGGGKW